jgi:hypothetical protein
MNTDPFTYNSAIGFDNCLVLSAVNSSSMKRWLAIKGLADKIKNQAKDRAKIVRMSKNNLQTIELFLPWIWLEKSVKAFPTSSHNSKEKLVW